MVAIIMIIIIIIMGEVEVSSEQVSKLTSG